MKLGTEKAWSIKDLLYYYMKKIIIDALEDQEIWIKHR